MIYKAPSRDSGHAQFGGVLFLWVSTNCHDAPTYQIEVSSFKRSGDRRGSQILKEGHVTRATPTLGAFYLLSVSTCHGAPTYQI